MSSNSNICLSQSPTPLPSWRSSSLSFPWWRSTSSGRLTLITSALSPVRTSQCSRCCEPETYLPSPICPSFPPSIHPSERLTIPQSFLSLAPGLSLSLSSHAALSISLRVPPVASRPLTPELTFHEKIRSSCVVFTLQAPTEPQSDSTYVLLFICAPYRELSQTLSGES
jgi:hypothetical protein